MTLKRGNCRVCQKEFTSRRTWQKFCGSRCRHIGWTLSKNIAQAETICVYCGLPGNSIDHIPPQTARDQLLELGIAGDYPFMEVRACVECNGALGARGLWTLRERKRFIKAFLKRRYKKALRTPEWQPEEILELGEGMRRAVIAGIALKRLTEKRIKF